MEKRWTKADKTDRVDTEWTPCGHQMRTPNADTGIGCKSETGDATEILVDKKKGLWYSLMRRRRSFFCVPIFSVDSALRKEHIIRDGGEKS